MNMIERAPSDAPPLDREAVRESLSRRIAEHNDEMIGIGQSLVRVPSENPSGDTGAVAELSAGILRKVEGAEVEFVTGRAPFTNVIARIKGAGPGRRVVLNGHLDTFPAGDRASWTVDPFGGEVIDGRLYGRGAADMKGGVAASMMAFRLMAQVRHAWSGELVLTLAADEETMGKWGSSYLLETMPHATGDALICGDAGSPRVIRFGEKGMVWLDLSTIGRASHGAHVHLGRNALDLLVQAIQRVQTLSQLPVETPDKVRAAIQRASSISEPLAGAGETEILTAITVNLGYLQGGTSPNLVPSAAKAGLDIRLPVGTSANDIVRRIEDLLAPLEGVEHKVVVRHDPTYSDPDGELFQLLVKNGAETIGATPVVNMRVGASDTRLFRSQGISSAVYGCTPNNMGGPNEFATLEDLYAIFRVHTLTAFDFLTADR